MIIETLLVILLLIVLFLAKEITHLKTKILHEWIKEIENNSREEAEYINSFKKKLVILHTEIRKAALKEPKNEALLALWDRSNELVNELD